MHEVRDSSRLVGWGFDAHLYLGFVYVKASDISDERLTFELEHLKMLLCVLEQ